MLNLIQSLGNPKILVIGDLILDRYIHGEVDRISPEGPIPVLLAQEQNESPGGAANVACNLTAMGADVTLAGFVGNDANGKRLKSLIKKINIDTKLIISDKRPTSVKTRFLSQGQQLLRLDEEKTYHLEEMQLKQWSQTIKNIIKENQLVICSDYSKGVFNREFLKLIFETCQKLNIPALVDPKGSDYSKYRGASLVKPNLRECAQASGIEIKTETDLLKAARKLIKIIGSKQILVTRGPDGVSWITKNKHLHQPTQAYSVYDVSGAGDSALAGLAMGWANKFDPIECLHLANLAGGIAVSHLGSHAVSRADLLNALNDEESGKILNLKDLVAQRKQHNLNQKTVVLTTGCFDLLHSGHLSLLRESKDQGDILVVGLNSDASVKKLKGKQRPITDEQQRSHLLAGFGVVDHVIIFKEDSPRQLIKSLKPDIWVKGSDYEGLPQDSIFAKERQAVESYGGKVHLAKFVKGHSTSNLVNKILNQ